VFYEERVPSRLPRHKQARYKGEHPPLISTGQCAASATSAEVASMCQYLMDTRTAEMEWLDAWWQGRGGLNGEQ
jgi:hypothetical protein